MLYKRKSRFLILMYHLVSDPESAQEARYTSTPEQFSRQIKYLRSVGYSFVSLSDIHAHLLEREPLPHKAVAITLDDGLRNIYDNAFPILARHKIPATIFLVSGLVGKTNEWMEREGFPTRAMLNWDQVREMQRHGIEIGAHTITHPRLTDVDEGEAIREIEGCKRDIQEKLGKPVWHFAYPYGAMSDAIRGIVQRSGFKTACSIIPGFNLAATDPFVLCRIEVRGTDSIRQFRRKLWLGKNHGEWKYLLKYFSDRLVSRIHRRV